MRTETDINLVKPLDAAIVAAKLIVGVTIDEIDGAVGLWSPYLNQQIRAGVTRPQHTHWDWNRKARAVRGMVSYVFCGITVAGEMQALALREDTFARSIHPEQIGTSLVYIPFLSVAPWNDRDIVPTPMYRGCGSVLIREAVTYSLSIGYEGRVGLHSLPQAEPFYHRCGMIDLGTDSAPDHQGLRYFEFTKDAAQAFLESIPL